MNNGQQYLSTGFLAQLFQKSVGDVLEALEARDIRPAFSLNDLTYYHAACVAELRAYFNQ